MKKLITIFLVFLTVSWVFISLPALAINVEIGQQVRLKARRIDLGVPLHRNSYPSIFGRVENGTIVEVLGTANNKHWLNIKTPSGKTGWVIDFYVGQVLNLPGIKGELKDEDLEDKILVIPGIKGELKDEDLEDKILVIPEIKGELKDEDLEDKILVIPGIKGELKEIKGELKSADIFEVQTLNLRELKDKYPNLAAKIKGELEGENIDKIFILPGLPGDPITPPPPPY